MNRWLAGLPESRGDILVRRLVVFFVALLTACLGVVQSAVASPRMTSVVVAYTYDAHFYSTALTSGIAERGPPTACVGVGAVEVASGSRGPATLSPIAPVVACTTYDHGARSAQFNNRVARTGLAIEALQGVLSHVPRFSIAAEGAPARFIADSGGTTVDRSSMGTSINAARQSRHLVGASNGGGYLNSIDDAQAVLNAFYDGSAAVLGTTRSGNIVVRVPSVTGFNNNIAKGYLDQPTNIFFIKGPSKVSVVPGSPSWTP